MSLNVHIINTRSIDLNSHLIQLLLILFKKYLTNPQKYSKIGYDIIMHFLGVILKSIILKA